MFFAAGNLRPASAESQREHRMNTIRIALLAGLIVLTQFSGVYAGYYETGNFLMEGWLASKRIQQNQALHQDLFLMYRFLGYVTGVADAALYIETSVTRGQLGDIVGRYLDSHPEERHEPGYVLVLRALGRVFPPRVGYGIRVE